METTKVKIPYSVIKEIAEKNWKQREKNNFFYHLDIPTLDEEQPDLEYVECYSPVLRRPNHYQLMMRSLSGGGLWNSQDITISQFNKLKKEYQLK